MNSKLFLSLSAAFAAMVAFADPNSPQITACTVTQDSVTHLVKATYTLDEPAVITFDVKTNGVSIGGANLTHAYGDVHRVVAAGSHTLYWQADKAWQGYRLASASFEVVAWATNAPPDYMVVDLVATKGARTYYTAPEQLPGEGGITNKMYKTDYLVMRKIPAKDVIFPMGLLWTGNQSCLYHRVKLTNDFYMAVYELTLGQMKNAIGESPANLTTYYKYIGDTNSRADFSEYAKNLAHPLPETPYFKFRGYTGSLWGGNFTHTITDTDSYLYQLRNALNISSLDLPTDAEWEFACRAGTKEQCYDGTIYPDCPTNIAWMANNSASTYLWGYTYCLPHEVGLLPPNAFGLYDMIGNVREFCLDLYNEGTAYTGGVTLDSYTAAPIVAPTGPTTDIEGNYDGCARGSYSSYTKGTLWSEWYADPNSTRRVVRGGCASDVYWSGASAYQRNPVGSCKMPPYGSDNAQDQDKVVAQHDTRGPNGYRLVCLP